MFLNGCLIYIRHDHFVSFDSRSPLVESFVLYILKFRFFFTVLVILFRNIHRLLVRLRYTNIGYDYSILLSRYFCIASCVFFIVNRLFEKLFSI